MQAAPSVPGPTFVSRTVRVRVPATSANLGPGFDCLGLALALHDDITATICDAGLQIDVTGEGAQDVPRDESHLIVAAMRTTFDRLGGQPPGLRLVATNRIPHGRGLGSSAAAIVAGVLLARALVEGGEDEMPDQAVLVLAAELEGHADNVAACLLGGATIAWHGRDGAAATLIPCNSKIRPVLFVPPFEAATHVGRAMLPDAVRHSDATFTVSRAALLVAALDQSPDLLLAATEDRLHQRFRARAMPETAALVRTVRAAEVPAVVSGAGPAVLALARDADEVATAVALAPDGWTATQIDIDMIGAHLF